MTEWVEFPVFITKGITVEKGSDRRIFKGHITAEIIDKQQEFIFVKEVMSIMKTFMEVNPVISDYHSNRMVGKVLSYEQSSYHGVATVLITAEVYKKEGITLYDKIWAKVLSGEYSGLSMGGASKERETIVKDGRMALELRKLELYEIALCDSPANPFAIIESVNTFAKAVGLPQNMVHEMNGREQIRCTTLTCKFEKGGTNIDKDVDIDNKNSHLEQFDKPTQTLKEGSTEDNDMEKHHQVGLTDKKEYEEVSGGSKNPAKDEYTKDNHISPDTELPCVTAEEEAKAQAKKEGHIDSLAKQTVPHPVAHNREAGAVSKEKNASPPDPEVRNNDDLYKKVPITKDVYGFIKEFGVEDVRKALVEIDTIEYLKSMLAKYQ